MPNWIGDLALALSVMSPQDHYAAHRHHPSCAAAACRTLRRARQLLIIPYRRGSVGEYRATLKQVRSGHFDAIYVLPFILVGAVIIHPA